ncbi:MAG: HlyD family secretion protein, partial [Candidatus Eremiobacteraeota bacterium]|nr:HlyD family secretion protein [Candidatus Eremiobacteraeota bacterium]
ARVFLDSDPGHSLDAYVMRIDPEAMFTPENTYFQSDRVQQVFGVKLALRSGFGFAKPGMPADGQILVGGTWPK